MSNDADKVVPFAFQMPWLVQIPLNILIAFGLIIRLLGWAGVAGALVMVALGEGGGVILMPPPCAFHPCLSIQNKQGCMKRTPPPVASMVLNRLSVLVSGFGLVRVSFIQH